MEVGTSHTHTKSNKDISLTDTTFYQKATIFKIVWKWKNMSVEQNEEFRYISYMYTYIYTYM